MMKKIIISAAILLLTGVTAFAVNHYQKSLNDNLDPLTKANIEAMRTTPLTGSTVILRPGGSGDYKRKVCGCGSKAFHDWIVRSFLGGTQSYRSDYCMKSLYCE